MMKALLRVVSIVRANLDRPAYRHLPMALAVLLVLVVLVFVTELPTSLQRAHQRVGESAARLKSVQDNLGEIDSLKARAMAPALGGKGLQEAVAGSLAGRLPAFSATLVDGNNVRVQGTGGFDSFVQWLAEVQAGHRVHVKSFSARRQNGGVVVDMTLSSAEE